MIRTLAAALAFVATIIAAPASAYWEYGHETVASIAYRNVSPATRAKIDALLRQSRLLETPTCPARTIEQASVWADCVKPLGQRFSYAYSWHYQNVDICKPFDVKSACRDGNCVSAQIERDVKLLQDKAVPVREKVQALAFLVHFVGDLHQPLHAGDRGDLGGNRARADYGIYAPEKFNLHSIWDGPLAERAISTPPSLVRVYSPAAKAPVQAGSIEDWSRDSWQVAKASVYATAMGDPCGPAPARSHLDEATIAKLVVPAREQVMKGGLRLARLLDEAFAPAALPPAK
ncbi:S1/P1 nuclease [Sphingomonas donggukensis]|uniref:S1/P1 nuclease n=1 Tax=Sphingomonas donggukensis TaxID=2949093 RepID=A0ABY4TWC4_9SPHN|nr:S1/P1 nuclease [Sphingomonas donggukensis]URW74623.1 S1/P1 nuclease [Sphingomonas donggukensis]